MTLVNIREMKIQQLHESAEPYSQLSRMMFQLKNYELAIANAKKCLQIMEEIMEIQNQCQEQLDELRLTFDFTAVTWDED